MPLCQVECRGEGALGSVDVVQPRGLPEHLPRLAAKRRRNTGRVDDGAGTGPGPFRVAGAHVDLRPQDGRGGIVAADQSPCLLAPAGDEERPGERELQARRGVAAGPPLDERLLADLERGVDVACERADGGQLLPHLQWVCPGRGQQVEGVLEAGCGGRERAVVPVPATLLAEQPRGFLAVAGELGQLGGPAAPGAGMPGCASATASSARRASAARSGPRSSVAMWSRVSACRNRIPPSPGSVARNCA
ncbi:hypothetical protein BJF90_18305 [Pseudonocardia sp. CNS-004]|nr:hypothetical protein BJF90_18305 [Pseudonocardia sp. CNS-004]